MTETCLQKEPEHICGGNFSFYSHKECEYFPCHITDDEDSFNCLFCFCPLYAFGRDCGGDFTHTPRGIMDCSGCTVPHGRAGYGYVIRKLKDTAVPPPISI